MVPHSHSVHKTSLHSAGRMGRVLDLNYSSTRHLKDTQFHWKKKAYQLC